jgi:5-methylcytosine-specific restriction endonuclease McrA
MSKKTIRNNFRNLVFNRDNYCCKYCGKKGQDRQDSSLNLPNLDAHHITNRNLFKNGGYVLSNGISLCDECHIKAEKFHQDGIAAPGYSVEDLYKLINSNYEKAKRDDEKLKT